MKYSMVFVALMTVIGLGACDRQPATTVIAVPGPAGPPGATGPAAQKGATGATGATGYTGATGDTGATGATGSSGAEGEPCKAGGDTTVIVTPE